MASIGGNLMQRPRCLYFGTWTVGCNGASQGRGARRSAGRTAARVLGTSDQCVATHPSDLSWHWSRLDAVVQLRSAPGPAAADRRVLPPARYDAHVEHDLRRGELIVAVEVRPGRTPAAPAT